MKAVGYATKAKRARPAEDGAARRHRRRRRGRGREGRVAKWCASPTRAAAKASSRCRPRRARSSGSIARAPRRSPSTPTRSRSTRTSSFRSTRLGDYTDGIERINIELSIANKLELADALAAVLRRAPLLEHAVASRTSDSAGRRRRRSTRSARRGARRWCAAVRARWQDLARRDLDATFPRRCRTTRCVVSWKTRAAARRSRRSSAAARSRRCCARCNAIHSEVLRSRVFIALHMHAGDGNVHTNIPVNSDDYAMLQEANAAVARIMALARALGRRHLRRARHRHHQARIPRPTSELAPFARLQARSRSRRAASTAASCCATALPADLAQRVHAELLADRPREPDPRAERRSATIADVDQGLPALRQVQAACARRTCRAPTCCTARATRSSRRRC